MKIRNRIGDALRRAAKRIDGRDPKVALVLGEMPGFDPPTELRFDDSSRFAGRMTPGMTSLVGMPVLYQSPDFKITGGVA